MFRSLFVLFIVCGVNAFANDDALLHFILSNENMCVREYDNDKIYLNEDVVIPTKNGIILSVNGFSISVNELHSDGTGMYVNSSRRDIYKPCPGCSRPYFLWCTNPDCPLKK